MYINVIFFYNDSVKLFYYLILYFIEGHKFISFILTVTCLPSLNEGFTLPYFTLTYDAAGNELTPWGVLPIMDHM